MKTLGIYIVAGKPIHEGHWQMIGKASKECDEALIVTSVTGRDEISAGVMVKVWKRVLISQFEIDYPNARLIIADKNPFVTAAQEIIKAKDDFDQFKFYSDDQEATKYSKDILRLLKNSEIASKFISMGIPRSETIQISGTKMREFLKFDDKDSFDKYAPRTLSQEMKDKYWSILKNPESIQDSKNIMKALVNERRKNKSLASILYEEVKKKLYLYKV
jgi:hypothetical protein